MDDNTKKDTADLRKPLFRPGDTLIDFVRQVRVAAQYFEYLYYSDPMWNKLLNDEIPAISNVQTEFKDLSK